MKLVDESRIQELLGYADAADHLNCLIAGGSFCCDRSEFLNRQFIELLLQRAPDERAETFPTLEEAIAQHDHYFADC